MNYKRILPVLAVVVGAVAFGATASYADGGGAAENMFNSGVVNFTSQQTPNGARDIQSPLGTFDLTKSPLGSLAGLNVGPR